MACEPRPEPVRAPAAPAADVYWARPAMLAAMLAIAAERGDRARPIEAEAVPDLASVEMPRHA